MRKFFSLSAWLLLLAIAVGDEPPVKQHRALRDADPFGGGADPFGGGADPFGGGADPFGGGADPFNSGTAAGKETTAFGSDADDHSADPFATGIGDGRGQNASPDSRVKAETSPRPAAFSFIAPGPHGQQVQIIEEALQSETVFMFLDTPLAAAIEQVAFDHNVPAVIDTRSLEDQGIDPAASVTLVLKGLTLQSSLRILLRPLDLTYCVHDEVLLITTQEGAEAKAGLRLYPVGGLLSSDRDGEWLVDLVQRVVAPDAWEGAGGSGAVHYVEHLETLVVRQTHEVLQDVGHLLAALDQVRRRE